MIRIGRKLFDANVLDVLLKLREEVRARSSTIFADVKDGAEDVMITCPWHAHGREHHPSCGVFKGKKNGDDAGIVHCFACGKSSTLPKTIAFLLTGEEDEYYGLNWLRERYGGMTDVTKREGIALFPQAGESKDTAHPEVLDAFRYYHPYMFKRKLTREVIDKFDIGYDAKTDCITFPVWDETGNLQFICRHAVDRHDFYMPKGVDKPVYLLNFIPADCRTVIVCESCINALYLWSLGKPAVALLGTGSAYQYDILEKTAIRKFILAFDGDDAGRHGRERYITRMGKDKIITYYDLPQGKDIDDLSPKEVNSLIEHGLEERK